MAYQSDEYIDENESYHKDTTRISKSGLDLIRKSPLHYYTKYLDPKKPKAKKKEESLAFAVGKACHTAVFEPEKFGVRYTMIPEGLNLKRNADKAKLEKFLSDNQHKICITRDEFELAMNIKKSVYNHPRVKILLENGEPEKLVEWTDPETGVLVKSRQDFKAYTNVGNFIVDLKTTEDASKESFGRSAYKYRYHVQEALYLDGDNLVSDKPAQAFIFVAVEKTYPFAIQLFYSDEHSCNLGRKEYLEDLNTYKQCKESGIWTGYSEDIQPLTLPNWAYRKSM